MVGIKNDKWIIDQGEKMIRPFVSKQVRRLRRLGNPQTVHLGGMLGSTLHFPEEDGPKVISYGVSGYGYDLRVAEDFKVFNPEYKGVVDPKNFDEDCLIDRTAEVKELGYCDLPPYSFALARTVEELTIPSNIMVVCVGKSTYARVGIICNVTPFEPEWTGYATLEITNPTPLPVRVYAKEGIVQALFFEGSQAPVVSYRIKKGKYQGQGPEIVGPRV